MLPLHQVSDNYAAGSPLAFNRVDQDAFSIFDSSRYEVVSLFQNIISRVEDHLIKVGEGVERLPAYLCRSICMSGTEHLSAPSDWGSTCLRS